MRTLLVALLVLVCQPAHAEGTGVVVVGEPALQQVVGAMVQGWLEEHGHTVEPEALGREAQKTFANCFVIEDLACARGVVEQQSTAASVVYVRVDLEPGKHRRVLLTTYWFVKGHDPVADKRQCARCSDRTLAATLRQALAELAVSSGLSKGRLVLDSRPSGLIVTLDGIKIGVTPLERDLAAGPHQIRILRDGRVIAMKAMTMSPGARENLVLTAADAPPQPVKVVKVVTVTRPAPSHSKLWPALLIGSGLAAGATGGVFLYYGAKGGPDDPYTYKASTTPGLALTIGGGALVVTGIIIALVHGSSSSGPTAAATTGGATVGWAGRF